MGIPTTHERRVGDVFVVPVVFLVLPVTVVFAFWPGVVGLHLVTP